VYFLGVTWLFAVPGAAAQNVLTYHGDTLRTGWFSSETQLTVSNVNAKSFGLLRTVVVDGRVDAEPLYVSQLTIPGKGARNVVFVVTENDSLYRIDADKGTIIGHRKLGSPVPYQYKNYDDNVFPVMGILGTPVIDLSAGVIYLVADTYNGKVDFFRLHAISITTLKDVVPPALVRISARLEDGSTWAFNPKYHLQRPGLLEANGSIYVAFGSTGDTQPDQSRGNIAAYDATTLAFLGSDVTDTLVNNTNPYYLSSIWQSGYAVAADSNGDIYFSTGNSNPSAPSYSASFNRPDSVVHLSGDLTTLLDSFTPSNYFQLDQYDVDLGSGGAMLLPDQPGSTPHLAIAGGKDGRAFLLNRDNLGGYTQGGPDNVLQTVLQGGCWCGPAYFVGSDGNPYILTGGGNGITSWQLQLPALQLAQSSTTGPGPINGLPDYGGSIPVVSSNGTAPGSAIVWFVQRPSTSSDSNPGTPVTLQAFDASNLQSQLLSLPAGAWTHAVNSNADIVPTVAEGKVYVASNDQVQIFGLLPPARGRRTGSQHGLWPSKPDAVSCPRSEPALASVRGGANSKHEFWGTVCQVERNQLHLALRSGRSISVDIGDAAAHHPPVVLSPGRAIHVRVAIDAKGVAHAARISPSHTLSALTPFDR
jgi:hypothetical protein